MNRRTVMTRMRVRSFHSVAALFAASVAAMAAGETAELRVTRVGLFSSGVAYFECEATVSGDARAELSFRTNQINDIIKSMVIQDLGGGSVGAVSYASQDPIEKTLKSFGVDITGKPTLGQLLDQLRGQPVEITGTRKLEGVIVGVEKQKLAVADKGIVEFDVLNILTDAGVQQAKVADLGGIRLTNDRVDAELRKALATLASAHDADKKKVVLMFNGTGERKVRVAYLLEAPIWKTTYRLVLGDAKPFLQGWATVENATEVDWKDVRLSLVSGRPISFMMDLYTPIYIPRPLEELELYASLRPPTYAGAFDKAPMSDSAIALEEKERGARREMSVAAGRDMRKAGMPASPAPARARTFPAEGEAGDAMLHMTGAGVESVAQAQEAGELFEYAIQSPVSLARQNSALLPIVNQPIDGEKLSIYNPATHVKHPLNGLQIVNSTGLNLMQGPVTVFDGNTYAGDAKLPDLKPGEKRLVAYALDLGMEVMVESKPHPEELVSLRIVKGTLIQKHRYVDDRTYVIKNKDARKRTLIVEQPYGDEWKLIEPKEPFERAAQLSRFKTTVNESATASLRVTLEQLIDQSILLSQIGTEQIRFYLRGTSITPALQKALEEVIRLRDALDQVARQRQLAETSANEAVAEQARVRENIRTLSPDSDAHKRQMRKFDEIETSIEQLRSQVEQLRQAEDAKRRELESYLLGLTIE